MLKTPIARGVALATLGATLAIPTMNCVTSISTATIATRAETPHLPLAASRSPKLGLKVSCCALSRAIPRAPLVLVLTRSVFWG